MGVRLSKQIAEQVIAACHEIGDDGDDDGRIDELLLKNEAFRRNLAGLSRQIPVELQQIVVTKKPRQRKDYGATKITEHRAFKSIWAASEPTLDPIIGSSLFDWAKSPEEFLSEKQRHCQDLSVPSYLDTLYHLYINKKVDKVRWRLSLIPLSRLYEAFERQRADSGLHEDLVTIITKAGLTKYGENIGKHMPSWVLKSKRYEALAKRVGYGGICCLPDDIGDLLWEKDLPQKGPVHETCINLLIDRGIAEVASKNVTGNKENVITANTAATKIIDHLVNTLQSFKFLSYDSRKYGTESSSRKRQRQDDDITATINHSNRVRVQSTGTSSTLDFAQMNHSHEVDDAAGILTNMSNGLAVGSDGSERVMRHNYHDETQSHPANALFDSNMQANDAQIPVAPNGNECIHDQNTTNEGGNNAERGSIIAQPSADFEQNLSQKNFADFNLDNMITDTTLPDGYSAPNVSPIFFNGEYMDFNVDDMLNQLPMAESEAGTTHQSDATGNRNNIADFTLDAMPSLRL